MLNQMSHVEKSQVELENTQFIKGKTRFKQSVDEYTDKIDFS